MADYGFNLSTNPRLDDFVKNFQAWFKNPKNPIGPNNSGTGGNYKYYYFVPSPDAIHLVDVKRMPFDSVSPAFFKPIKSTNSGGNSMDVNTPLGWKMQLGELYTGLKSADMDIIKSKQVDPGLTVQVVPLQIGAPPAASFSPGSDTAARTFSDLRISDPTNFIDSFSQVYERGVFSSPSGSPSPEASTPILQRQTTTDITYEAVSKLVQLDKQEALRNQFVAIEWYGYFKAPTLGNYSFKIDVGTSDYGMFWIGNKAVCEYVASNPDLTSPSMEFKQTILDPGYIPIRMQYFVSKSGNPRKFALKITNNDTNAVVDNKTCLFTIDYGNFFPKFLYAAFTSSVVDDFKSGKFRCYTFGGLDVNNYNDFYSYMKRFKRDIFAGVYDTENRLGAKIQEYGTLLNGINYTDGKAPDDAIPNKLSVYRVYADLRMGKNYQVDIGSATNGQYTMREISSNIIKRNNEYTAFPDYYPPPDFTTAIPKDVTACAAECNNNPECNFYYSYSSADGNPYCAIGGNYAKPVFNQIPSDGKKNGSLYLRENKLSKPTVNECISKTTGVDYSKIVNTTAYDTSNPYYQYSISGQLDKIEEIGFCDDPAVKKAIADYERSKKEAQDILYNYRDYDKSGKFRSTSGGDFVVPNFKLDLQSYFSGVEGFKTTDAVDDTAYNINSLKIVQNRVAQNNTAIQQNYLDLSNNLIPTYLRNRDLLNSDAKYDFSGNILLYLKDQKIPSKDEQRITDSIDVGFSQTSLYALGSITVATLLILAIMLARD
jgi:hypothetical protein